MVVRNLRLSAWRQQPGEGMGFCVNHSISPSSTKGGISAATCVGVGMMVWSGKGVLEWD